MTAQSPLSENAATLPVTAVVPVRNRLTMLQRALSSIARQTALPEEVIVVDDGSTVDLEPVVRSFAAELRTVLLRQENRGPSAARNLGIRLATQPWIAFLDSDDEWQPDKLRRQFEALSSEPRRFCHCDEIWLRSGEPVSKRAHHRWGFREPFAHSLERCVIAPSTVVAERSLLLEVGLFDEGLPACEDYDLWLRILVRQEVLYVDETLVIRHAGHADQLSSTIGGLDRFRVRALEKLLDPQQVDAQLLDSSRRAQVTRELERKQRIVEAGAARRSARAPSSGSELDSLGLGQ